MRAGALLLFFLCLFGYGAFAQDAMYIPKGNPDQGRLIFAQCRTCHYPEKGVGHNNGPSLHQIFGKVVGSQQGFAYYSEFFYRSEFYMDARTDVSLACQSHANVSRIDNDESGCD